MKSANKPNTFQVGGHGNPSLMVDGVTGERLDTKKFLNFIFVNTPLISCKQHPERNLK